MDKQFDFIVSSFAFHHLTDEQKELALIEMMRVLKPHGRICITDVMFRDEEHKYSHEHHNEAESKETSNGIYGTGDCYYATCSQLLQWFELNEYITKHQQLNEWLHIVYAVSIR